MTGIQAFRKGCGVAAHTPGLVFALYGANLLLALPLAIGFMAMMKSAFGSSMAPDLLLEGFDFTTVRDALAGSGDALRALIRTAVPTALVGMLMNTAMAGGILHFLFSGQEYSARVFFEGIGKYIGRFLRLWAVMTIIGVVSFLLLSVVSGMVSSAAMDSGSDRATIIGAAAAFSVYAPLLLVVVAGDYAKIHIVSFDLHSAWRAAGRGFLFLLRNPVPVILLQFMFFLLLFLATVLYWGIDAAAGMTTPWAIFFLFCLQQVFAGARVWIRTATFGGAAALFESRKPQSVIFYGWDDSPEREVA